MFTDSTKYACMVTSRTRTQRERINPSLPSWMAGAPNNTEEKVLVAWNTELRVSVEVIFFSSLVQQCLEKWVIE